MIPNQKTLTVISELRPGYDRAKLRDRFHEIQGHVWAGTAREGPVPFAAMKTVHYARFVIVEEQRSRDGRVFPPCLVFSVQYDGSEADHLKELISRAHEGLREIYEHCVGFDAEAGPTPVRLRRYLRAHAVGANAFFIGARGRTVARLHRERRIYESIQMFLRTGGLPEQPEELHRLVREHVEREKASANERDRNRARELDPDGTSPSDEALERERRRVKLRFAARFVGIVLLLLSAVVALWRIPLLGFFTAVGLLSSLFLLRMREDQDADALLVEDASGSDALNAQVEAELERRLTRWEDRWPQNQLTVLTLLKPSRLRRALLWLWLEIVDLRARFWNTKGLLHGVPTIHFAHWLLFDRGRRLLFISNFDGSWISYLEDFIVHAPRPLTAIWSHGERFPKTRLLFYDGAAEGPAFKAWARRQQLPPEVWYSAYPDLTVAEINRNTKVVDGLRKTLDRKAAREWLALL